MLVSLTQIVEAKKSKPTRRVLNVREPAPAKRISKSEVDQKIKDQRRDSQRQAADVAREKEAENKKKSAASAAKVATARDSQRAKSREPIAKKSGGVAVKGSGLRDVPAQIAHCMMAVHVKRRKSKKAAWNICRWAMTKYGYLKGPYRINTKMPKAVQRTTKGVRRSFQHGMETHPLNGGLPGSGTAKFNKFVGMFSGFEKEISPKKSRREA